VSYTAPVGDLLFALEEVAGIEEIAALPGYGDVTPDLVRSVLEEAGKFASGVIAPLNPVGDRHGSRLENGVVRTPDGFRDAYAKFVAAGWNAIPFDPEHGGQGLPWSVAMAVQEMVTSACMSFSLCPLLTQGAVELLTAHGSAAQKRTYLPKLVSGEWTGTMNLTEPQAGSDVGALRTRAARDGNRYRITGQKIFITYGEHDWTDNIVHMVLARTPDAPPGIKGISLFIVPKYLPRPDGTPGERNDLRCVSLEEKLGIHGSPTALMSYGDNGGAIGELVGEENRGIEYMFTMMNNARLSVGVEGPAIAERAYQQARDYAKARVQGRAVDGSDSSPVPIIRHPDVQRMLMTMRAQTEAMRALVAFTAGQLDRAKRHPDAAERARHQALVDLLTPVVKAWCTDTGCAVASTGIQVHGGLGFIEATGAAQHYRDCRIAPIYEGTNGIQAMDLVGRKLMRDDGEAMRGLIDQMAATLDKIKRTPQDRTVAEAEHLLIAARLHEAVAYLKIATEMMIAAWKDNKAKALAVASPYLTLVGTVTGGWLLTKLVLAARRRRNNPAEDGQFLANKERIANFYATDLLPQAGALQAIVMSGSVRALSLAEDQF
jgi:alkylation response protein AidB-like acyl-CoA dehydrogenase